MSKTKLRKEYEARFGVVEVGFRIYNAKGQSIYYEYSDGHWVKRDYGADGEMNYYENSWGGVALDNRPCSGSAEEPQWSDNLDPDDNQTWVLCYLSDDSPEETWHVDWVSSVTYDYYWSVTKINDCDCWKYATPVDLNVRFKKEEG